MSGTGSLFADRSETLATHDLFCDPPHALSQVYRETCRTCGSAALQAVNGPVYGSASEMTCNQVQERHRVMARQRV